MYQVKECLQTEQVQEFIAKRKLFTKTYEQIKIIEEMSFDSNNSLLRQLHDVVKSIRSGSYQKLPKSDRNLTENSFEYNSKSESPRISIGKGGGMRLSHSRVFEKERESIEELFTRITTKISEVRTDEATIRCKRC